MAVKVYRRTAPPYPWGVGARDYPRSYLLYSGVDPFNLANHEGKAYLLEMTPFDAGLTREIPGPPYPWGYVPRRTPRSITVQGNSVTIYPAATGNGGRSTANDDTPAATWVPGKLSGAFNYEISLFSDGDPTQGGSATLGILELIDPDGELDDLRTLAWDGAPIKLRRGLPFNPAAPTDSAAYLSTYETVANLTAAGLRYNNRKKEIQLRDLAWSLMQAELHGNRYLGTGTIEGDATLKGRIKPIAFGVVFNVPALQINAASLIYQVSCTSVLAFDAVRDGGVALTNDGDFGTYAALAAATISAGHFATCKALGIFRLGATSVYPITADVRGDNDTLNGVTYPSTRAGIARRIATGRGAVMLRDPFDIDGATFATLDNVQTATVGFFWDAEITKAEALNQVMAGCAGWWTVRLNGRLAVGQLEDPTVATPVLTVDYQPTTSESRLDESDMVSYQPPRRNTLMGWSRNYTVMATNQIAGAVSQANAAIYQKPSRYTTSENLWVAGAYPSAAVVTVDGGFSLEADAQREGDRLSRIFARVREAIDLPAVIDPFAPITGTMVQVLNANRGKLGASATGFCYGIAVNGNNKPVLKLWV